MMQTYYRQNLKYLREKIELDYNALSEISELDVISLWELEQEGGDIHSNISELTKILGVLSDYYTIEIDKLVLDNIESLQMFPADTVHQLKLEIEQGIDLNRKDFKKRVFDYQSSDAPYANDIEAARDTLKLQQQLIRVERVYRTKRVKGEIGKNDFFESQ